MYIYIYIYIYNKSLKIYIQLKVTPSFTLKGDLQTELKSLLAWGRLYQRRLT